MQCQSENKNGLQCKNITQNKDAYFCREHYIEQEKRETLKIENRTTDMSRIIFISPFYDEYEKYEQIQKFAIKTDLLEKNIPMEFHKHIERIILQANKIKTEFVKDEPLIISGLY